ncbi:MAG TPA: nuclear transport factor 2 family protein [Candidatus Mediterraneibacter norfolkensis]|nr:nuclear transport factor 2 family protein [Candidatus Mediterraneibacter norfolkensis]
MFSLDTCNNESLRDRLIIRETVEFERYCRDYGLWSEMKALFLQGARVRISWFDGNCEDFIQRSGNMSGAKHKIYNTVVQVHEDKALAEIIAHIQGRQTIEKAEGDMISYVRLLYRLRRVEETWKILSIDCIYEKDMFLPLNPDEEWIADAEKLQQFRESYKYLCYVLSGMGEKINLDLPGEDRPELVRKLYDESFKWLHSKV